MLGSEPQGAHDGVPKGRLRSPGLALSPNTIDQEGGRGVFVWHPSGAGGLPLLYTPSGEHMLWGVRTGRVTIPKGKQHRDERTPIGWTLKVVMETMAVQKGFLPWRDRGLDCK